MRQYRNYSWKRKRVGVILLLLLLCVTFFVSCIAGSGELLKVGLFEKDAAVYLNEPMQAELSGNDETVLKMVDTLNVLPTGSVRIPSFERASDVVSLYRDAILNDLLRDNYSLYTGNVKTLTQTGDAYPHTVLTTAIPAVDFENAANRLFGTANVRHKNGEIYTYLNRSGAYTTVLQPWESAVELEVDRVEETQNTYRFYFTLSDEVGERASYCAVFVKRTDGDPCLQMLRSIA